MPRFLNTKLLNQAIPQLIDQAKRELIIITPYVRLSEAILRPLTEANRRGVETIIVCREESLSGEERSKLEALDNLNLMYHPNVHCKCWYTENHLLLSSMNVYEYSEVNNREMGVLAERNKPGSMGSDPVVETLFLDALTEIKEIINGAHMERPSRETEEEGFEIAILKDARETCGELCRTMGSCFGHKRFEPMQVRERYLPYCSNYFDKMDLLVDYRLELGFRHHPTQLEQLFLKFNRRFNEYSFEGVKVYWNRVNEPLYLYSNGKSPLWQNELTEAEKWKVWKQGVDAVIGGLRGCLGQPAGQYRI